MSVVHGFILHLPTGFFGRARKEILLYMWPARDDGGDEERTMFSLREVSDDFGGNAAYQAQVFAGAGKTPSVDYVLQQLAEEIEKRVDQRRDLWIGNREQEIDWTASEAMLIVHQENDDRPSVHLLDLAEPGSDRALTWKTALEAHRH